MYEGGVPPPLIRVNGGNWVIRTNMRCLWVVYVIVGSKLEEKKNWNDTPTLEYVYKYEETDGVQNI